VSAPRRGGNEDEKIRVVISLLRYCFSSSDGRARTGTTKGRRFLEGQFWQFKLREWDAASYNSTRLVSGIYEISYSQNQLKAF
jgi:hypothetical protein